MLQKQHRIVIADGGAQQALCVARIRRRHHLQPRHMLEPGLEALRMMRAPAADRALLQADHQRNAELAAGNVAQLGGMVDQLAHRQGHEIDEHDLDDRPLAGKRGAGREPHDAVFADRSVDDAALSEFFDQPGGHPERTADRDVLAEYDDAAVPLHLLRDRLAQAVDVSDLDHLSRYAYTKSATDVGAGHGLSVMKRTASFTRARAVAAMVSTSCCVAAPRSISRPAKRRIGSLARHSATSSALR